MEVFSSELANIWHDMCYISEYVSRQHTENERVCLKTVVVRDRVRNFKRFLVSWTSLKVILEQSV